MARSPQMTQHNSPDLQADSRLIPLGRGTESLSLTQHPVFYDEGRRKLHPPKFHLPPSYPPPIWAQWVGVSGTNIFKPPCASRITNKTVDKQNRTRMLINRTLTDLAAAFLLAGSSSIQLRPATGNSSSNCRRSSLTSHYSVKSAL